MNYLEKLVKSINSKQKKQRINSNKNLIALTVLGVAFVGTVSVLLVQKVSCEIRNIIINNAKDPDEDIYEDVDLDIDADDNIDIDKNVDVDPKEDIEDEIKENLEKQKGKSIGAVGTAMEEALENLEDEE
ncbi:hypothetical protein [Clostridium sp.]